MQLTCGREKKELITGNGNYRKFVGINLNKDGHDSEDDANRGKDSNGRHIHPGIIKTGLHWMQYTNVAANDQLIPSTANSCVTLHSFS